MCSEIHDDGKCCGECSRDQDNQQMDDDTVTEQLLARIEHMKPEQRFELLTELRNA